MDFYSPKEINAWCAKRRLRITSAGYPYFVNESLACFRIPLDGKPHGVINLAGCLASPWGDETFNGALLWVHECGIWTKHCESTAKTMLGQMRYANGATDSLIESPGHLFGPRELYEMHSHLLVPMLFGWDAVLIPESRNYFLFVSHESFVIVVCQSQSTYDLMYDRAKDWNPENDKGWYLAGLDLQ